MLKENYDFAGWATKNDIKCSDGLTIRHDAFKENDKMRVPLVWEHLHSDPTNVLGHVELENRNEGVYAYGYFNSTPEAQHAKELLSHGDIVSMSIAANKIKRQGSNVVHGRIFEVSLVLARANPGALIESIMSHGEDGEESAIIYTDNLLHSADVIKDAEANKSSEKDGGTEMEPATKDKSNDKTIGDVLKTLNEEQTAAVEGVIASILNNVGVEQSDDKEGEDTLKHNVFDNEDNQVTNTNDVLTHSEKNQILEDAKQLGTLKQSYIQHGIQNIEYLFPDAKLAGESPFVLGPTNTAAEMIVNSVGKTPFARVKNLVADLTEDEARAKGYIKGTEKIDQVYKFLTRETYPQTIYKKQSFDRDDVADITDFDLLPFTQRELKAMLIEELGRAILVGDGRDDSDPYKIKEDKIRPIIKDEDFYTIKKTYTDLEDLTEVALLAKADLRGSGSLTLFIDPKVLARYKLQKGSDGRFLQGHILSNQEVAANFGVSAIKETTLLPEGALLFTNLNAYKLGSTKMGEITTFDDFDIDFNKLKFLIETRLSGAAIEPYSSLYITVAPPAGA